jgi:hypothetical protein
MRLEEESILYIKMRQLPSPSVQLQIMVNGLFNIHRQRPDLAPAPFFGQSKTYSMY